MALYCEYTSSSMQCSGWSILATIKLHLSVGGLSPLHITFTTVKSKTKLKQETNLEY